MGAARRRAHRDQRGRRRAGVVEPARRGDQLPVGIGDRQITGSTRQLAELRLGVSPRGTLSLARASRAYAAANGRHYVTADDIKELAALVLPHRMILTPEAELQGYRPIDLMEGILNGVPVPQERLEV